MRRRRLRKYLKALADLNALKRDELHQAIGAAKKEAGRDARHVKITVSLEEKGNDRIATLTYQLDRASLRVAWRREGRYLLRTDLTETDPARLWECYLQLTEVEQAFKELKGDLAIRPIIISLRVGSSHTSSSASWPTVCKSPSRRGSNAVRAGWHPVLFWRNLRPSGCSMFICRPPTGVNRAYPLHAARTGSAEDQISGKESKLKTAIVPTF